MVKKHKDNLKILFFIIIAFFTSCAPEYIEREEFLMDTVVSVKIFDAREDVMERIFVRLKEIDEYFNNYDNESEIGKINSAKDAEVQGEVSGLISRSLKYAEVSKGAFNPAMGELTELWNIRGEERDKKPPEYEKIKDALNHIDYKKIIVRDNKIHKEDEDIKIDLGAIVKGYATEEIKKILTEENVKAAIVDLGGNIMTYGNKDGDWTLGIQDPFNPGVLSYTLKTEGYSTVVTSGNYERYFEYEGKRYHHIMNPETGYPVESDYSCVSILNENSEIADMLSTALYVLGPEKSLDLLKYFNSEAAFIMNDGRILMTKGLKGKIEDVSKDYKIEILGD